MVLEVLPAPQGLVGVHHDERAGLGVDGEVVAEVHAQEARQALQHLVGAEAVQPGQAVLPAALEPLAGAVRQPLQIAHQHIDAGHPDGGPIGELVQQLVLALEQLRVLVADLHAGVGQRQMPGEGRVEAGEHGAEALRELQPDGQQGRIRAPQPVLLEVDARPRHLRPTVGGLTQGVGPGQQLVGQPALALAADAVPVQHPLPVARLRAVEGTQEQRLGVLAVGEGPGSGEGLGAVGGFHGRSSSARFLVGLCADWDFHPCEGRCRVTGRCPDAALALPRRCPGGSIRASVGLGRGAAGTLVGRSAIGTRRPSMSG
ncbi:hypothetical protein CKO31_22490 [Thiohalocapsa halophila]|uniref:Uncharacterized protein n=1 Tax=Thiohalocapsa halophila TaxID=69359 RepID=A0ABS1CNG1_9GAMM|nr:hypothetical protein [Thiohalocapsa halophila]MBK1633465.1 hypothetical protein [Thiohalocapsa halophila]